MSTTAAWMTRTASFSARESYSQALRLLCEEEPMKFRVIEGRLPAARRSVVFLRRGHWDDWFKYSTLFGVEYWDAEGQIHELGATKIGKFGLAPARAGIDVPDNARYPKPPESFSRLGQEFFSVGQDSSFYERIAALGDVFREEILKGLRDLAFDQELLSRAEKEDVTRVSLLRSVPLPTVREQFNRLAHGGALLTSYDFHYPLGYTGMKPPPRVSFEVRPGSLPPTNIHVLIGRNGVGKSRFLNELAKYLVKRRPDDEASQQQARDEDGSAVTNLVSVSFSAFDSFEPLAVGQDRADRLTYHYVGLKKRRTKAAEGESIKGPQALAREMSQSIRICFEGARKARWLRGLRLLEGDPVFAAVGIADMVEEADRVDDVLEEISAAFGLLSSGHKIVLLTTTKLVETVEEKSLVLLDEPEAHLHPPLLSAFVRALSDLLINRNGVAIIATHSPVVLQEVPRSCVYKINRLGQLTTVERPQLETFGENVGTLTDDVFGLEVTATGFHRMLWEAANRRGSYEDALAEFNGQLGAEGKAILRSIVRNLSAESNVGR